MDASAFATGDADVAHARQVEENWLCAHRPAGRSIGLRPLRCRGVRFQPHVRMTRAGEGRRPASAHGTIIS
ncbi:hypothetical protein WK25_23450 [Burkholderia latens]|nr:hypothetical protein WK25_23450 [Burkholderia latens]